VVRASDVAQLVAVSAAAVQEVEVSALSEADLELCGVVVRFAFCWSCGIAAAGRFDND
jgi:hypothetical protein